VTGKGKKGILMFQCACWKPRFDPRGTQGEIKITLGDTKI